MDKLFKTETFEEFTDICDKILKNLFDHDLHEYDNLFFNCARKQIRELISSTYCNVDEISQKLIGMGYERMRVDYISSAVEKRQKELLYLTLLEHSCKQGETVANFDWTLKLVCGTSELKTLKYTIMQLLFTTFMKNGGKKEKLYDIDKNMLNKFIETLENIDKNI